MRFITTLGLMLVALSATGCVVIQLGAASRSGCSDCALGPLYEELGESVARAEEAQCREPAESNDACCHAACACDGAGKHQGSLTAIGEHAFAVGGAMFDWRRFGWIGDGSAGDVIVSAGPQFFPVPQAPVFASITGSALEPPVGLPPGLPPFIDMPELLDLPQGEELPPLPEPPLPDSSQRAPEGEPMAPGEVRQAVHAGAAPGPISMRLVERKQPLRPTVAAATAVDR